MPRNLANFSTLNTVRAERIEIQTSGVGLIIYDQDPNVPEFSFNPSTFPATMSMTGNLNVTGDATFQTITVNEFQSGLQALASTNPGDTWDLGLYGQYENTGTIFTGIARDASDPLQRWAFFDGITSQPTTVIPGLDSTKLDSVRMNFLYVNDGTATTPSLTFHNDTLNDTGLFLDAEDDMGFAAGGVKIMNIRELTPSSTEVELNANTVFKMVKFNTIDDTASMDTPAISTGHMYFASESASDKWLKFFSAHTAATPSYSGIALSATTNHFMLLNTGGNLKFVYSQPNEAITSISLPDYRDASVAELLDFVGSTSMETKVPVLIPSGSLGSLSIRLSVEPTTGFYRSGTNSIGIASAGINILNVTPTGVGISQQLSNVDGLVGSPSITFTSDTDTGIWRSGAGAIAIASNGVLGATFSGGATPQIIMPVGGTAAAPSYSFSDSDSGLYVPTNESLENQIALSLGGVETWRFRKLTGVGIGNTESFNSMIFTPGGVSATTSVMAIYSTDTRINNTLKGYNTSLQSYNLIDESHLLLYTFGDLSALGADKSGNNLTATLVGTPNSSTCEKDANSTLKRNVLDLTANGVGTHYLDSTANISSFQSLDDVTFSFWFKISGALSENNTILNFHSTASAKDISFEILSDGDTFANALQITIESTSLTTMQYHTATAADPGGPSIISVKDGLWHHVLVELGGSSMSPIYFDNVNLTIANKKIYFSATGDNAGNPELSTNSLQHLVISQFTIGVRYDGITASLKYTGFLKDLYITNQILSSTEINILSTEAVLDIYSVDAAIINACDINATGQLFPSDGSALAPAYTFLSDPDSGMYSSTANTIGFSTGGSERLTISDTTLQYNSDDFQFDSTNRWISLGEGSAALATFGGFAAAAMGPRIVFSHTNSGTTKHSIRSAHKGDLVTDNAVSILIDDTLTSDAQGLGEVEVLRVGLRATGANNGIVSVFGELHVGDGTSSLPAWSFVGDTNTGIYRIGADNMGVSTGGTLRLDIDTSVTVGNAAGDISTKLYVPLGTQALPTYSFIGDVDTGIFSSGANNMELVAGNVLIANYSTTGQLNQEPIIIDKTSTEAFLVRTNNDPAGGDMFSIDTSNNRIGFGYSNLFLSKHDTFNSGVAQRLKLSSITANTGMIAGLLIFNELHDINTANTTLTQLSMGRNTSVRNCIDMLFNYQGDNNSANRLQFGFNGVNTDQFNIRGDGSTNVTGTFTVSSFSSFGGQIQVPVGGATTPSYSFGGDATTGFYRPSAQQIGVTTNGLIRHVFTDSYEEATQPLRLSDGAVGIPSLTFSSDTSQNTGLFWISNDRFAISNGGVSTFIFDGQGVLPHECQNDIAFKPDGSNVRVLIDNDKLRISSNQTILTDSPVLHFKFLTDPNTDATGQDTSISHSPIILNGSATHVTSDLGLVDVNGLLVLDKTAIEFTTEGNNGVETTGDLSDLVIINEFIIFLRFKIKTLTPTTAQLCILYGNAAVHDDFIQLFMNSSNEVNVRIETPGNVLLLAANVTSALVIDTWYELKFTMADSGNSFSINGSAAATTYTTGSSVTTMNISGFGDITDLTAIVGGTATLNSMRMQVSEFYISPTSTTEVVQALVGTQAHSIYTNKIQLANTTGLINEGYLIRSDGANNLIWDNSLFIKPSTVELTNAKVFRVPDGTSGNPAYSFTSDPNSGIYSIGADNIGISTNGVNRLDVGNLNVDTTVPLRIPYQSGNAQLTIGRNGTIGSGLRISVTDFSSITGLIGNLNDAYIFANSGSAHIHLAHNGAAGGIVIRNSDATTQTRFAMFGSDGTNFNQSLEITTVDSGAVADLRIHARSANDAANPTYSFFGDIDTGLYAIGANNLGISTGGVKRVDVSDAVTQVDNDFQTNAGIRRAFVVDATLSRTLGTGDNTVEFSNTGVVTCTLPECTTLQKGREYTIIKTGASGTLNIQTFDSNDHIDNNVKILISFVSQFDKVTLLSNGVDRWYSV